MLYGVRTVDGWIVHRNEAVNLINWGRARMVETETDRNNKQTMNALPGLLLVCLVVTLMTRLQLATNFSGLFAHTHTQRTHREHSVCLQAKNLAYFSVVLTFSCFVVSCRSLMLLMLLGVAAAAVFYRTSSVRELVQHFFFASCIFISWIIQ